MENEYIARIKAALEDKKANDIKILDISELTTVADFMVIADASNTNQLDALIDAVYDELAKDKVFPKMREGDKDCGWVLLDYRDILVQLFITEMRSHYDLERIWRDGKEI